MKDGDKNVQAAAYHGARMVLVIFKFSSGNCQLSRRLKAAKYLKRYFHMVQKLEVIIIQAPIIFFLLS